VVSGAARGQALLGPMWAGLTTDSKGDPTDDTEEPDRRRQETPHLSARRKGALPKVRSPGQPERERESFIRNNLHNGVVSGAARGQALLGPMWAAVTVACRA